MTDDKDNDKTEILDATQPAAANRRIGHYEVLAELGRGGMGAVYRGYESSLNRYVAIKVLAEHLADDGDLVARFEREAKAVAALNHPNIVHIYTTGEQDGLPYFVMECVEGETLADRVRQQGPMAPRDAAGYVRQAASGLAAAHKRGIIHRDIKPSNLMVDKGDTVKITDFGIALAGDMGSKLTATGQFVGTSGYVSPEVFRGSQVDARSDIFSLGVVLFELLAGVKPFDDDSPMGLMIKVVEQPAPDVCQLNPRVDDELKAILARMIAKDPAERYPDCETLIEALDEYLASAPTATRHQAPPPTAQRRSAPVAAVVGILLAVGAGGAYWWWQQPAPPQPVQAQQSTREAASQASTVASVVASASSIGGDGEAGKVVAEAAPASQDRVAVDAPQEPETAVDTPSQPQADQSGPVAEPTPPQKARTVAEPAKTASAAKPQPQPQPEPEPAPPPPPEGLMVAVRGDSALVPELTGALDEAMRSEGRETLDSAFIPGVDRALDAPQPDLALLRGPVLDAGARYLAVVTARPVGSKTLEYYGQTDQLYSTEVDLVAYDLTEGRRLGRWSETVEYTQRNAGDKASVAAGALARQWLRTLP